MLVISTWTLLTTLCRAFDGIVPLHFYGVMAKTELGCEVLQEKGHFTEFAQFIRRHGLESEDQEVIFKLKSVLWAVVSIAVQNCLHNHEQRTQGNIGATVRGLPFLEEEEIIPSILEIAEQSLVLSVRGYVPGLGLYRMFTNANFVGRASSSWA